MEPGEQKMRTSDHTTRCEVTARHILEEVIIFFNECYRSLENPTLPECDRSERLALLNQIAGSARSITSIPEFEAKVPLSACRARLQAALIVELLSSSEPNIAQKSNQEFTFTGEIPEGNTISFCLNWKMAFFLSLAGLLLGRPINRP
jgi:hypothetical protein